MLTKDLAICIRAIDFSETSQIVTFFTRENGKVSAIAKGSKRPKSTFDGPIEIFSHGKIVFSDSTREKLATLTEFWQRPEPAEGRFDPVQPFGLAKISRNLLSLNCAYLAAELINNMTDYYDPHPELFDKFLQFLKDIQITSQETRDTISVLILFQLILLKEVGLKPILQACVNCKNSYSARWKEGYFSSSANGLICRDCEASFADRIKLSSEALMCLADVKLISDTDEKTLYEIEKVLIHHFTETLGHRPRMAKHILTK